MRVGDTPLPRHALKLMGVTGSMLLIFLSGVLVTVLFGWAFVRIRRRDLRDKAVMDVTSTVGESEDRKVERREARENEERPIFWDKTEGAVKAGDAPVPDVSTEPARASKPRKRPSVRGKETT